MTSDDLRQKDEGYGAALPPRAQQEVPGEAPRHRAPGLLQLLSGLWKEEEKGEKEVTVVTQLEGRKRRPTSTKLMEDRKAWFSLMVSSRFSSYSESCPEPPWIHPTPGPSQSSTGRSWDFIESVYTYNFSFIVLILLYLLYVAGLIFWILLDFLLTTFIQFVEFLVMNTEHGDFSHRFFAVVGLISGRGIREALRSQLGPSRAAFHRFTAVLRGHFLIIIIIIIITTIIIIIIIIIEHLI